MKQKLNAILHTTWNEPRHLFFWMAMLSLCGFAAVAQSTTIRGATIALAFVALGCELCFLASFLAFVLAWIPPLRRLMGWLLGRRYLAAGCLVTLVALLYAIENWQGQRAWRRYERAGDAKGERYELTGLAQPPVPRAQNFFETPLWSDLRFVETNRLAVADDVYREHRVVFTVFGTRAENAPKLGTWTKAQRADLTAWQAFYRGTNNWFQGPNGTPTNYFPMAKEPQAPATDVLLALSKFDENRQLLIAAAERPQARFWINYDAGPILLQPHLVRIKAGAQYLSLHAIASLKAGDREAALQDVRLVFRLLESIREEPILISHLVRIAALQIGMQPVWEGLADRCWSEADLTRIEEELGKLDFLSDYGLAMRGERGCNLWAVDYISKVGMAGLEELIGSGPKDDGTPELWRMECRALFRLIPSGWFDHNKVSLCRRYDNMILPAVDRERRIISPALVTRLERTIAQPRPLDSDFLARLMFPSLVRSAERFAYAQSWADLARVACALERYRLANGQFPEGIEALAPKYLEKVPSDVISGQSLRYLRTGGGQFVLYSVGWNRTDDGGRVVQWPKGGVDMERGDWVWRYPGE